MRRSKNKEESIRIPPARTPEQREKQMINYAVALAEKQLREGTASSQVITHYLKLATVRERNLNKKLETEIRLNETKNKAIQESAERDRIYQEAIEAMMGYRMPGSDDV